MAQQELLHDAAGNSFSHVVALDRDTGAEIACFTVEFLEPESLPVEERPTREQMQRLEDIAWDAVGYYVGGSLNGQEAW